MMLPPGMVLSVWLDLAQCSHGDNFRDLCHQLVLGFVGQSFALGLATSEELSNIVSRFSRMSKAGVEVFPQRDNQVIGESAHFEQGDDRPFVVSSVGQIDPLDRNSGHDSPYVRDRGSSVASEEETLRSLTVGLRNRPSKTTTIIHTKHDFYLL